MATESIGATARDRVDIPAWEAALAVTLTEQEIGEGFNDSELTETSTIDFISHTTTSSFDIILRAASGEGYVDTGDGVAWRYNATNGVAVRRTTDYDSLLEIAPSVNHMTVEGWQWSHDNSYAECRGTAWPACPED